MKRYKSLTIVLCFIFTLFLSACGSMSEEVKQEALEKPEAPEEISDQITENKEPKLFLHPSSISNIQPTTNLQVLVPLYKDPENGIEDWQKIAEAASKVSITVIINPSAGPAGCQQEKFQEALNLVTTNGVTVLGYVPTGFGARAIGLVQQDITSYQACSQVGGIFLDEVSREASQIDTVRNMCSYVHGAPRFQKTVLNVGTSVDNAILEDIYCDTVVSFERDISSWVFSYDTASVTFANPNYFATLIHSTSTENIYQAVDLARTRGFGHIYISSDALPNPWSKLPVYWESTIDYIALGNSSSTPPVTDSSMLINSGFDTFEGWINCGDATSYYIANSSLNLTAGSCVYQTVEAIPGYSYTLTCTGNTIGDSWNTFILSSLDSNWQSISQDFKAISSTSTSQSITVTAPSNAAHIAIGFYSEGAATYSSCNLVASDTPPVVIDSSLINPSFDTFEGWVNCGDSTTYFIANGTLVLTSGACVYQTVPAIANKSYTLTCTGNAADAIWSTFILSALDSNWNTISQVFQPLEVNSTTQSLTFTTPSNVAHLAVSFYTEGNATYQECSIN